MTSKMPDKRAAKVVLLFSFITLGFLIFIGTLVYWARIDRRLPTLETTQIDTALRGKITSFDKFTIANGQKLYKVMVDTRNIDPKKLELFVRLYSIYSSDNPKKVKKILKSTKGNVILSYKIDSKKAQYLKELARKLYKKGIFIPYEDPKTGLAFLRGMSIVESGESRNYPSVDTLTPIIGYVKKIEKDNITKVEGVKGLEKYYEEFLRATQDEVIVGLRDIGNNLIQTKDSLKKTKIDGYNLKLNISLKFQKILERILDKKKEEINAKELVAAVMKSDTGEILAIATSNRYDPANIQKKDYQWLNPTISEFEYEPGSVMKPFTFALLLKAKKINPYDLINTHKGKFKLGRNIIRDTHDYDYLSAEDVIVHSSNIGMVQISQKLDAIEFQEGLKDFGFSLKSGIDLPYEQSGFLPATQKFNSQIYKATIGYGYGMRATFIQILTGYNVFNNGGFLIEPKLANKLEYEEKQYVLPKQKRKQILPLDVAKRMQQILIKTVQKGTGRKAKIDGLEIGGKTGTAHIASKGGYANSYNSSFFGFANDDKNHFTIGVLAREPKKRYHYFASMSAVPTFKNIVEALIEEQYLAPKITQ